MFQNGRPLQSIDDSLGRVIYRDMLHGWLFVGQHRPVVDALRVTS